MSKADVAKNIHYALMRAIEEKDFHQMFRWVNIAYSWLIAGIKRYGTPEETNKDLKELLKNIKEKIEKWWFISEDGINPVLMPSLLLWKFSGIENASGEEKEQIQIVIQNTYSELLELINMITAATILAGFDEVDFKELVMPDIPEISEIQAERD